MAPVYLNPPVISPFTLVKLKEEQHDPQLFLSPQQAADHPTFFNTATTQYQGVVTKLEESKPYDPMVNKFLDHDGSNDREASSSSSVQSAVDIHSTAGGHNLSFSRKDQDVDYDDSANNNNNISSSSVKWMSSKMRLMKKMMSSNCSAGSADNKLPANYKFQYPLMHDNEINNSIRVCSDCNTTTTPLWRTGPRGPKSLCNACGIRQRKARRAMEAAAAANGAAVATDATWVKIKAHNNKEKKSRLTHIAQYKKLDQFQVTSDYNPPPPRHHHQNQTKLCLKEFALNLSKNSASQRVFPQDVEDAAILLMELSCGLSHS